MDKEYIGKVVSWLWDKKQFALICIFILCVAIFNSAKNLDEICDFVLNHKIYCLVVFVIVIVIIAGFVGAHFAIHYQLKKENEELREKEKQLEKKIKLLEDEIKTLKFEKETKKTDSKKTRKSGTWSLKFTKET